MLIKENPGLNFKSGFFVYFGFSTVNSKLKTANAKLYFRR